MTTATALLRVLMIEDNAGDLRLMREAMAEPDGARVHLAHAGTLDAGLETLRRERFDVVLLDLSLPDSHGLDTVRRFRQASPALPVVVMTSLDDEQTALAAVADGAQDYLVKGKDAERRLVERALRYAIERQHAQEQLAEARKLDAMGRLAGGVAHELNNLITTIIGSAELLMEAVGGDADLADVVTQIHHAGLRAAAVTEQVLAVGGRKRVVTSSISLNAAIRQSDGMLRETLGSHTSLTLDLGAAFDAILFNAGEVEHILAVLALNALEAMPDGGVFAVQTCNETLDEAAARSTGLTPGLHVVLTLRHSGAASSQHGMHSLEPFAKPRVPGAASTGLSLAGINGTLRACGARIVADSAAGSGTTFTISFPHRSGARDRAAS